MFAFSGTSEVTRAGYCAEVAKLMHLHDYWNQKLSDAEPMERIETIS